MEHGNDSDIVEDELSRRQKRREDRSKRSQDKEPEDPLDLEASLKGDKWKESHMQLAASSHGLRTGKGLMDWTGLPTDILD